MTPCERAQQITGDTNARHAARSLLAWGPSYDDDTILSGDGDDKLEGRDGLTETDKFYGGLGNDEIKWSKGINYIHGGQPVMPYEDDGTDLVDYTGVGIATLNYSKALIPDLVPDFTVVHSNGTDFLFSIERLCWSETNDQLVLGKGIELLKDKSWFQFFDQSPGTDGDIMDFSREQSGLLYRPSDEADIALIQGGASPDDHSGIFVESLETLIGSAGNDRIYASSGLFKVDSGEGDDLLDGRGSAAFSGLSVQGYDLEIYGGEGDDTIISGSGRSLAIGGAGARGRMMQRGGRMPMMEPGDGMHHDGHRAGPPQGVPPRGGPPAARPPER